MDRKHFENLHVGDWVTAVEVVEYEEPPGFVGFGGFRDDREKPSEYWSRRTVSGLPVQIKAMSYPFMVVNDGENQHVVDSRNVSLVKVSKGYVRQAMQVGREEYEDEGSAPTKPSDPGNKCPRCHYPGNPRMIMTIGGGWNLECPNCGLKMRE